MAASPQLGPDETSPLLPAPTPSSSPAAEESGALPANDDDEELSNLQLLTILGSIWVGVFLAALDSTVISTLLAPISTTFQSFDTISWITTSYLISQAALQPLAGKLTDIYSRRTGLLVSNILFGVGTAMCGFANTEAMMIIGRVVAGAGGGGLTAISSIVGSDLIPLRKRGLFQGFGNIAYGSGAALGGLYGGVISDSIGWRWAFIIQLPVIFLSTILVGVMVNIPVLDNSPGRWRRIDFSGSITLVSFLVLFLLALSNGEGNTPTAPTEPSQSFFFTWPFLIALSLIFLCLFIYTELYLAREPIMPLQILSNRTTTGTLLSFFFMTIGMFGAYFYIPIYSLLTGSSATSAGLRLTPFAVGISAGSLGVGMLMNHTGKYYKYGLGSLVLFSTGLGSMAMFSLDTSTWVQILALSAFGIGYGAHLTVGLTALMASVKQTQQATTTSASYLFRATGGTIGAAVGSAVFKERLNVELVQRLGTGKEAKKVIEKVTRDFGEVVKLDEQWRMKVEDGFMSSLRVVFFVATMAGLAALGAAAVIRELTLHRKLRSQK